MADPVEILLEKLRTTDRGVIKASLIEELGNMGDHRALKPLIEALNDSETLVRWNAIKALGAFGRDAAIVLLKMLDTDDLYLRRNIVQALGEIGGHEVTDRLIRMLMFDETDKNVLIEVIRALDRIRPPRAVDPLITVLKTKDWEMRWRAIHTLGRIGDPKAMEPLLEAMKDSDPDIRWAANVAVESIKANVMVKETDPEAPEKPAAPLAEKPAAPSRRARDLALSSSVFPGSVTIHVDGELNAGNSQLFSGFVEGAVSTSTGVVMIDLRKCDFVDSFALSTLNAIRKKMKARKRPLKLSGLNPNLKTVFSATKLDTLFEVED